MVTSEHRAAWVLHCLVGLGAAMPTWAQVPSTPVTHPSPAAIENQAGGKIRKGVSLVTTPVTVLDRKGELVSDLVVTDFTVNDNGIRQKILHFDLGNGPLSIVILFENSSRVAALLPDIRRAGIVFSEMLMGAEDEAAIWSFHDSVDRLTDFTTNHELIQNTINELKEGTQGCKLFDALAAAVEMLSGRHEVQPTEDLPERRRIIVVVSEANDVGSEAHLDKVLHRALLSNVTIYSVGLSTTLAELKSSPKDVRPQIVPQGVMAQPGPPGIMQTPNTEDLKRGYGDIIGLLEWAGRTLKNEFKGHPLETLTAGTGGRYLATSDRKSMEKAVGEIGGELHLQYLLTYEPNENAPGFHRTGVHVDRKDLKVRQRPGYYVSAPES
jgi:VWFA-related protein